MDQIAVDQVVRVDRARVRRRPQGLDHLGRKRRARRTEVIVRNGVEAVAESGCGRMKKDDAGGYSDTVSIRTEKGAIFHGIALGAVDEPDRTCWGSPSAGEHVRNSQGVTVGVAAVDRHTICPVQVNQRAEDGARNGARTRREDQDRPV